MCLCLCLENRRHGRRPGGNNLIGQNGSRSKQGEGSGGGIDIRYDLSILDTKYSVDTRYHVPGANYR